MVSTNHPYLASQGLSKKKKIYTNFTFGINKRLSEFSKNKHNKYKINCSNLENYLSQNHDLLFKKL